ncbi:MAG: hypothetical protein GY815_12980 [Gammaproteobacteria bacterium]|nr:hypothetical protein [Gammaproteobacteria bacterium]
MIDAGTVGTPANPGEQSWTQRLFSPEKTMDLIMGGMQGYGQAGIAKEQMEYPEKIAEKNAKDWQAAYPGRLSLEQPRFPSQEED